MVSKGRKIIIIVGPTGSGKSVLGIKLAKKYNGEIISADSRQVYKHLNLSTGKDPGKWKKINTSINRSVNSKEYFVHEGVIHHCIDFVSPKRIYTAQEWKKQAQKAIDDILRRGKIPIIVGGTAFYIYALVDNIKIPQIPADWKLREKLGKKSNEALFKQLQKLDPRRAKSIDPYNRRRLIRAIEITKVSKAFVPQLSSSWNLTVYDAAWFGVKRSNEELKKRIKKRLEKRIRQGMIKEIKDAHFKHGITWKRLEEILFYTKDLRKYLHKELCKEELMEEIYKKEWRYTKRQMTWWKKDKRIRWVKAISQINLSKLRG